MSEIKNLLSEIKLTASEKFKTDVINGLSSTPKYLQSKYFYDAEGDKLFQQIMESPEYYLTNCELEIFSQQTEKLGQSFLEKYKDFDVVELGAGDATKSIHLLKYLAEAGSNFTYYPVDISKNVIHFLETELPEKIPGLKVKGLNGEYFDMIKAVSKLSSKRKLILFLGGNIGNFAPKEAIHFLTALQQNLLPGHLMLIGFDLKKNPKHILAAYNDKAGVTREFNLNLLKRINRELDADFKIDQFDHYPTYNPATGACRSYLISLNDQQVRIGDSTFDFIQYEAVYMELSQKYSISEIDEIAEQTGFKPVKNFFDSRQFFLDAIWEKL